MSTRIVDRIKSRQERAATHLGDGVYASTDGYHIWLRVDRGYGVGVEEIALDSTVLLALDRYRRRLWDMPTTADMPEEL